MAVVYKKVANSVTRSDQESSLIHYLLRRALQRILPSFDQHEVKQESVPTKFFPTEYKNVIKAALTLIQDPMVLTNFKRVFRKILTNVQTTNREEREAKILFTLFRIAGYLRKIGDPVVADSLLAMICNPRRSDLANIHNSVLPFPSEHKPMALADRLDVLAREFSRQRDNGGSILQQKLRSEETSLIAAMEETSKRSILSGFDTHRSKHGSRQAISADSTAVELAAIITHARQIGIRFS